MNAARQHEWRQFRLLSRDSVRRLLDSVLVSRDADPMQFALWGVTLALTPPLLVAVRKIIEYPFLMRAPASLVQAVATADRTFFLIYGMLATALLAALTWDALFPDRQDQEILGVLPVRPRTLAAARLAAAATTGVGFAAIINLPTALIYSAASSSHPLIGAFPRVLAAHIVSTTAACAFVFFGLMSLRALVAICAGDRMADRLAIMLQLTTIVLLVEVFLFLPAVLEDIVAAMQEGRTSYAWLPPMWFAGLFMRIAEGKGFLADYAGTALMATIAMMMLVVATSLLPAAWMGRRALESRARERASTLTMLARGIARLSARTAVVRSLFIFGVASLARSRRHALLLATYLGLAIAAGILKLVPAIVWSRTLVLDEPRTYTLALPLVLTFFAVFGLRASFAIPTEFDANWIFRLIQPSVRDSIRASRLLILVLGVAPVSLLWTVVALSLWPAGAAIASGALNLVSGMLLTEIALANWTKVPFATAHVPATDTLKSKWPWYLIALYGYEFTLAALQIVALRSAAMTATYIGVCLILVVGVRRWRLSILRRHNPTFDAPTSGPLTLDLSGAVSS